ncbi:phage holin family protein [Alkalihalophilus lindianensis]|uniref:Phage holin family protein n=1 Tax=Alkalihalophilus lindianensis TaxID=1630542 RepID=A0ABU3X7I7_9BACI|nr:phage holin family protein [Alkalihalophilus lindianensis]MDV2683794.1 phage holin family protein [Alkalihalophilus lindianensis]MDV2683860.1 phage holin family protein [Alkalihalophilus lindianensis]
MENITVWVNRENLDVIHMYLFGGVKFLDLLALLMLIDVATGITRAIKEKRLRSRTAYYGYARKVGAFGIIIVANIIDIILDLNGAVAIATVLFYISVESLSILENYTQIGGKVPKAIKDSLHVIDTSKGDEKRD